MSLIVDSLIRRMSGQTVGGGIKNLRVQLFNNISGGK